MSYGTLYTFSYTDYLGRYTTVNIKRLDYAGTSEEIFADRDPLEIEGELDNDFLFSPIMAQKANISIISETNMKFVDLFSANAFKHQVEVWKEPEPDETQELFWKGYILPDEYNEPLDFIFNYPVKITARDVLGGLKDIKLYYHQAAKIKYTGREQVIKIIAKLLAFTKLDLNINFAVNLQENNAIAGNTTDPLERIFLDWGVFYLKEIPSVEDCLFQVLQAFGCQIKQSWGEWWIERVPLYNGSHIVYKYDKDGVYIDDFLHDPIINYTGKDNITNFRNFFVEKQGQLYVNPAFKGFVINQDYGKRTSIVNNNSFEEWGLNNIPGWNISSGNLYWEIAALSDYNVAETELNKWALRLNSASIGVSDHTLCVSSTQVYLRLTPQKGIKITWKFYHNRVQQGFLQVYMGTGRLALSSEESSNLTEIFEANATYTDDINNPDAGIMFGSSKHTEWKTYTINYIPTADWEGYVSIYLRNPTSAVGSLEELNPYHVYDEINIDFINQEDNIYYPEGAIFSVTIDDDNNETPSDINSILGDLPELEDNEDIYYGGFWLWNGGSMVPTKSWKVIGTNRNMVLMTILAEAINDQYIRPKHKVDGKLKGYFDFAGALKIAFMTNKLYLPIRITLNDKRCEWDTEMLEIITYTEGYGARVLATSDDKIIYTNNAELIKV